jgi:hypothetical protein
MITTMHHPIFRILAIIIFIEAFVLTVGTSLYFGAYKKMKHTPIIGCLALMFGTSGISTFNLTLTLLFPSLLMITLLMITKTIFILCGLLFIKVSLTPDIPKSMKKLETELKKHSKKQIKK